MSCRACRRRRANVTRTTTASTVVPGDLAVTVEVFSRWLHEELARALGPLPATLGVRVWESPVAFGGYIASLAGGVDHPDTSSS
jgi:hypothetical protein